MDILLRYHLHFFGCFLQWPTLRIVKLVLSRQSAISQEWPLNKFFFSVIVASHTTAQDCVKKKKIEKKKERKRERERKKERKTNSHIACVASVSAGVRRECWDESKKEARNEKGGDGEKRKPLIPSPSPFFYFVFLSLQLWRNNSIGNACYAGKWSTKSNDKQW